MLAPRCLRSIYYYMSPPPKGTSFIGSRALLAELRTVVDSPIHSSYVIDIRKIIYKYGAHSFQSSYADHTNNRKLLKILATFTRISEKRNTDALVFVVLKRNVASS